MKKINVVLLFIVLCTINVFPQTCTLQSIYSSPANVQVELTMTGFTGQVTAFQWSIDYDPAILTYVSTGNWFPPISGAIVENPTPGKLNFIWGDMPVAVNGILCKINFTYNGPGCSYLNFTSNPVTQLVADEYYNTYYVTYVNGQVCGGSCSGASISTQPSNQHMCAVYGNADISVTAAGPAPFTYQWQYFNGSSWISVLNGTPSGAVYSNANTATLNVSGISAANTYNYRCYITNCSGANNVTSNAATLTVYSNPPVPSITETCIGSGVTLATSAGASSYLWSNGDTTQSITVTTAGNFSVQTSDANGCSTQSLPWYAGSSLPFNICIVSVDSISGYLKIIWNEPPANDIDHINIYIEGAQPNTFSLLDTVNYYSLSVYIDSLADPMQQAYRYKISAVDTCGVETVLSNPHKSIHLTISPGTYDLNWTNYEGFTFASYHIYRGTSPSDMTWLATVPDTINFYTDLNPPAGNLYYQVEAVNPTPCSPSKSKTYAAKSNRVQNESCVGINTTEAHNSFRLFPNPADELLTIIFTENIDYKTTAEIFSMEGKLLKSISINHKITQMNISDLPSGVFIIKIADNKGVAVRKIIKK
ncbi:MAG TPA: T9SS type A sorting domain-containing protein [Bacteroidales bacterium]|nr:T9SS type A sorting domain-containing protein [Bacteroidales bacterium]